MSGPRIGLMNESSLHETLKFLYTQEGDEQEVLVHGYIVDIKCPSSVIEIQTGSFCSIRKKLETLLKHQPVKLVHPIAVQTTLHVLDNNREKLLYKRKSPLHGDLTDLARQIIYIPSIITHPHFSLEVVLTEEEQIRSNDGLGSWRRKGISKIDRRLLGIKERHLFTDYRDYLMLLPAEIPPTFTNNDLAHLLKKPLASTQRITYALRKLGLLQIVGKQGRANLFAEAPGSL